MAPGGGPAPGARPVPRAPPPPGRRNEKARAGAEGDKGVSTAGFAPGGSRGLSCGGWRPRLSAPRPGRPGTPPVAPRLPPRTTPKPSSSFLRVIFPHHPNGASPRRSRRGYSGRPPHRLRGDTGSGRVRTGR
ncbi:hypothetical protein GCM10027160_30170 [Streptomyces calidiresistens]